MTKKVFRVIELLMIDVMCLLCSSDMIWVISSSCSGNEIQWRFWTSNIRERYSGGDQMGFTEPSRGRTAGNFQQRRPWDLVIHVLQLALGLVKYGKVWWAVQLVSRCSPAAVTAEYGWYLNGRSWLPRVGVALRTCDHLSVSTSGSKYDSVSQPQASSWIL